MVFPDFALALMPLIIIKLVTAFTHNNKAPVLGRTKSYILSTKFIGEFLNESEFWLAHLVL